MKNVLCTGTCGFIMGNLIRKAIYEKQPYKFISLDKVNYANSIYWNKNHTFHIADITNPHILDIIFQFEQPDIVIHGAAETLNPDYYLSTNVLGTQNIINACAKYNVKLIYLSSGRVYASKTSAKEDDLIAPSSLYEASKATGEMLVKTASIERGLKYNILRLSDSYGPRQNINNLIPQTIKSIIQNEKIQLSNDGSKLKDLTHVFDHCAGILAVLNSGADNEIYNISANQEFSDIEVVYRICKIMNKGHNDLCFKNDKSNNDYSSLDSTKLKQLNWEPQFKFKSGIQQTVNWYETNQWFFK